jgi:hypothetical protein
MKAIINQYLLFVLDKFIKLGMRAPHVIPKYITKFDIQLMHILAAIAILSSAII